MMGRTTCCSSKKARRGRGPLDAQVYFPLSGASYNRKLSRSGVSEEVPPSGPTRKFTSTVTPFTWCYLKPANLRVADNPLGDRWLAGTPFLGDDEVNGVRTNMAVSSTRKFLQAFDKLFTPSLTLRKLRPRFSTITCGSGYSAAHRPATRQRLTATRL